MMAVTRSPHSVEVKEYHERMRIRNMLTSAFVCFFLLGPLLVLGAQKIGLELPDLLSSHEAAYWAGDAAEIHLEDSLHLSAFRQKELQAALETKINGSIPAKAWALLGYAASQRIPILASNHLFGFESVPSRYSDASTLLDRSLDALMASPSSGSQAYVEATDEFSDALAGFASRHPQIRFCIAIADISSVAPSNPAMSYVEDPFSAIDMQALMEKAFRSCENIDVVTVAYANSQEYYQRYYTSDHHWNGWGAMDAYDAIADKLGYEQQVATEPEPGLDWIRMNGSYARSALYQIDEPVSEPRLDLEGITAEFVEPIPVLSENGAKIMEDDPLRAEFSFYEFWYGRSQDFTLANAHGEDKGNGLLVCDSYGTALKYLLAKDHDELSVRYDLSVNTKTVDATLEERIEESGCDTVYFVAWPYTLTSILEKNPEYFQERS